MRIELNNPPCLYNFYTSEKDYDSVENFVQRSILTAEQIGREDVASQLKKIHSIASYDELNNLIYDEKEEQSVLTDLIHSIIQTLVLNEPSRLLLTGKRNVRIDKKNRRNYETFLKPEMKDVYDSFRLLEIYFSKENSVETPSIPITSNGEKSPRRYGFIMPFTEYDIYLCYEFHGVEKKGLPFQRYFMAPYVDVSIHRYEKPDSYLTGQKRFA